MKNNACICINLVSMILLLIILIPAKSETIRERIINSKSKSWQLIFGNVDFTSSRFFNCMTYLHPQHDDKLMSYNNILISEKLVKQHKYWIGKFFTTSAFNSLKVNEPVKYYLGDKKVEPGYLKYESRYSNSDITLLENGDVLFMIIKPDEFVKEKKVTRNMLIKYVKELINLDDREDMFIKYLSNGPEVFYEGFVYLDESCTNFLKYRDWRDHILIFSSKIGICVMLFKYEVINEYQIGFKTDLNWLNSGLIRK